jgi:predicted transcriptional regulator
MGDTLAPMSAIQLDEYDLWLLEAAASGKLSVEELSEKGHVPKSTAYRRVPALARKGLLATEKRDSGIGRPALIYSLTEEGLHELRSFSEKLRNTVERLDLLFQRWTGPLLPANQPTTD